MRQATPVARLVRTARLKDGGRGLEAPEVIRS